MNHFLNWVKKEWFAVKLFGHLCIRCFFLGHLCIRCFFFGHLCIRSGRAFQCESLDGSLWEKKGEKEEEGELEHYWPHSQSCQVAFTFSATFSIEPDNFHFRSKVRILPRRNYFHFCGRSCAAKIFNFHFNEQDQFSGVSTKEDKKVFLEYPPTSFS